MDQEEERMHQRIADLQVSVHTQEQRRNCIRRQKPSRVGNCTASVGYLLLGTRRSPQSAAWEPL